MCITVMLLCTYATWSCHDFHNEISRYSRALFLHMYINGTKGRWRRGGHTHSGVSCSTYVVCRSVHLATEYSHWVQPLSTATEYSHWVQPLSTATEHSHWVQPLSTATEYSHWAQPLSTATEHSHWVQPLSTAYCTVDSDWLSQNQKQSWESNWLSNACYVCTYECIPQCQLCMTLDWSVWVFIPFSWDNTHMYVCMYNLDQFLHWIYSRTCAHFS